ncbi:hypothetical protein GCM10020295_16240 [Streptomyces cinereospinus]
MLDGTLIGTWQSWLTGLGRRVRERYAGEAPDAGVWTPEHTAFLARLESRRADLTAALGADGFSLNRGAAALSGIVEDAVAFGRLEEGTATSPAWAAEARTGIALELAAARLLARCAAPVMPRFAARLAAALGEPDDGTWPETVQLVKAGGPVALDGVTFFVPARTAEPGAAEAAR